MDARCGARQNRNIEGGKEPFPFDLNIPVHGSDSAESIGFASSGSGHVACSRKRSRLLMDGNQGDGETVMGKRRAKGGGELDAMVYKDNRLSKGGQVKEARDVLRVRADNARRRPNVNCRVETFGKICSSFDVLRTRWVAEMGFGGLLNLVDRQLPRSLCYWLMTRIDPMNEMLHVGNKQYRLSVNQVRWVLGIPKGEHRVPSYCTTDLMRLKIASLSRKYDQVWTNVERSSGKVVKRKGFAITQEVQDKLVSPWEEENVEEFKTLFLMAALDMVLCPTQCRRFSADLHPALVCAADARKYNWCDLVLDRLMASVRRFARSFYTDGYAAGCGGCTLFVAVFYMDKLARNPVLWGIRPRIKVWTVVEMRRACNEDRGRYEKGDFGKLGVLDIAYGERHPFEARDTDFPSDIEENNNQNP